MDGRMEGRRLSLQAPRCASNAGGASPTQQTQRPNDLRKRFHAGVRALCDSRSIASHRHACVLCVREIIGFPSPFPVRSRPRRAGHPSPPHTLRECEDPRMPRVRLLDRPCLSLATHDALPVPSSLPASLPSPLSCKSERNASKRLSLARVCAESLARSTIAQTDRAAYS